MLRVSAAPPRSEVTQHLPWHPILDPRPCHLTHIVLILTLVAYGWFRQQDLDRRPGHPTSPDFPSIDPLRDVAPMAHHLAIEARHLHPLLGGPAHATVEVDA